MDIERCPVADRFGDPATIREPTDYYAELRADPPVFFSKAMGAYIATRYADVQQLVTTPDVFTSCPTAMGHSGMMLQFNQAYEPMYLDAGVPAQKPTLVVTDGDEHKRYRGALDQSFTVSSVKKLEGAVVELVNSLIDKFIDDGKVDLYSEFCLKLPLFVICDMLGLPRSDAPILKRAADVPVRLLSGALETQETVIFLHKEQIEFHKYLMNHLAQCRAHPDDTLISQLIHTVPPDGVPLSDQELLSIITTLNVGGNETTTNGLGNMFMLCFRDPEMQIRLKADRDLIPKFVEEALRIEAPVAVMVRWALQNCVLGGTDIPKGSTIMAGFLAANRDERQFPNPDEIGLDRKGLRNHLAFGSGPHYCLGAALARMELKVSMNIILDRMQDIKISSSMCPLEHEAKLVVRALKELPINFIKA